MTPNDEYWVTAPGYPNYAVSNQGRVMRTEKSKGTKPGKILKPKVTSQGYWEYTLRRDGAHHYVRAHRLVCEAFHGPPGLATPFACHKDDNPSNNCAYNVYWGSRQENAKDAIINNRYLRGEVCGSSRFSEKTIRAFLQDVAIGEKSMTEIARSYGISKSQGSKIARGHYWKHLHD